MHFFFWFQREKFFSSESTYFVLLNNSAIVLWFSIKKKSCILFRSEKSFHFFCKMERKFNWDGFCSGQICILTRMTSVWRVFFICGANKPQLTNPPCRCSFRKSNVTVNVVVVLCWISYELCKYWLLMSPTSTKMCAKVSSNIWSLVFVCWPKCECQRPNLVFNFALSVSVVINFRAFNYLSSFVFNSHFFLIRPHTHTRNHSFAFLHDRTSSSFFYASLSLYVFGSSSFAHRQCDYIN